MLNCKYLFSSFLPIRIYYALIIVLLVLFILVVFNVYKAKLFRIAGFLVVVGGLLNMVERIKTGCVYDPFNFINLFHFNSADVLISLGIILLTYRLFNKNAVV